MRFVTAALAGLLFGLGLLLAGMTNPAKVLAFLDLAGTWDPSLALVMLGAIGVSLWPMQWAKKHRQSLLGSPMCMPSKTTVDRRLILGSLVFGMGWGLVGICPGPAVSLLLTGQGTVWLFFISLILGMGLFKLLESVKTPTKL